MIWEIKECIKMLVGKVLEHGHLKDREETHAIIISSKMWSPKNKEKKDIICFSVVIFEHKYCNAGGSFFQDTL